MAARLADQLEGDARNGRAIKAFERARGKGMLRCPRPALLVKPSATADVEASQSRGR